MSNLKSTKILFFLLSIQLIFISTNAMCNDTLTIENGMIESAITILKKDGIDTEKYKASAMPISNAEYDANYVVTFKKKLLPGEPPMFGGGYSVYFKRENNESKFVIIVDEQ